MANPDHVAVLAQGVVVWNKWRKSHPDVVPDLSGIRCAETDLPNVNFARVNLDGSWLRSSRLPGAILTEASLVRADFVGTQLGGANLTRSDFSRGEIAGSYLYSANLEETKLVGTNIAGVNFNRATLAGADLSGAIALSTVFANLDLSRVKGLPAVEHRGPSTIGIDTLYKSRGSIPDAFLRGAGVPDSLIAYAKALVTAATEFYSCFISYSHVNKSFARRLHDTLQSRGVRCWLDEKQLLPGHDIYDEVDRGIRLWDKVLLCCSEDSLTSWWVDNEIATALEKEQRLTKERGTKIHAIIPIDMDGYLFMDVWKSGYRAQLRRRLAADFTGWVTDTEKFDRAIENVIRALRSDQGAMERAPRPRL
jgi:hypothetical protein